MTWPKCNLGFGVLTCQLKLMTEWLLRLGESEGPRPSVSWACGIDLQFLQWANSNSNSVATKTIDEMPFEYSQDELTSTTNYLD